MAKSTSASLEITSDGGVTKHILKEGNGQIPALHATCLVHYVGRIEEDESIFLDTRSEGSPVKLVAGRDSVLQGSGLHLAVAKMKVGEVALVRVKPEYGYGAQGNFSFPSIPPSSSLTYEVELLGFDPVQEGRASGDMLFEERLEAAERQRLDGNVSFKAGDMSDALGKYAMALSYMDQDFMFQLYGPHEKAANAVRLPTLLNMAACHLQLADYQGAIEVASQVLNVSKDNTKALYRRGKAFRLAGQTESAAADLQAAKRLSPQDPAIAKELQELKQGLDAQRRATADLFRGRLPPGRSLNRPQPSFWQRQWQALCRCLSFLWSSLTPTHQHEQ